MAVLGVVFDLGHTLMHLDSTWPEVFERGEADLAVYISRARLSLDAEAFARAFLRCHHEGYARAKETLREVTATASMRLAFAGFGIHNPDPALIKGAIDAFFAFEDSHWHADMHAKDILRDLAGQGIRLGMFSNASDDRNIQLLVRRLGLAAWLDPILSSAGTGIRKPDPAAFAPFLEVWGLPAWNVAMVGDTLEADIMGARRAGMKTVWIRARSDSLQEDAANAQAAGADVVPDGIIDQLKELPDCIARL